jgi:hypothetical protein
MVNKCLLQCVKYCYVWLKNCHMMAFNVPCNGDVKCSHRIASRVLND